MRTCSRRIGIIGFMALALAVGPGAGPAGDSFPVTIGIDANRVQGEMKPVWRFFGHDEPNYTYMKDGKQLLGRLASLSPEPVYIRTHNLLTSGDGTSALKWGSTGVYSEDAEGKPDYDWTILDRIFDTYKERGVRPYVQIGFMPEALSTHPEPYQHRWTPGGKESISTGWAYPPRDYDEVGRTGLPVGAALRRPVRRGRGGDVVLGGLERAEHPLLAGHARGVSEDVRLRRRRREAGPAHGAGRRPARRRARSRRRPPGSSGTSWSTACGAKTTRPARRARRSTSSRSTPRVSPGTSRATFRPGSAPKSATSTGASRSWRATRS